MKKNLLLLLLLVFLSSSWAFAQKSSRKKTLKPTLFNEKVSIKSGDKTRTYYALDASKAALVSLKGPGVLRVITRCAFTKDQKDKLNYEVLYTVDGGEQQTIKIKGAQRTTKATYKDASLGTPGQLEDFEIQLGRADHTIQLLAVDGQAPVAVRYIFAAGKVKKQKWIAFNPVMPNQPVDLITRENIVSYSRFSIDKPLRIEVIGPTQVRVLTRVENHYNMRGRIQYRIQVKEEGEVINTYSLSSKRSQVTVYSDDKSLLPGTACEFVIDVPKGKHTYEIMSLDKDKSTVLGRFLIPKTDVKLSN